MLFLGKEHGIVIFVGKLERCILFVVSAKKSYVKNAQKNVKGVKNIFVQNTLINIKHFCPKRDVDKYRCK